MRRTKIARAVIFSMIKSIFSSNVKTLKILKVKSKETARDLENYNS